jgi:hypothetical protein
MLQIFYIGCHRRFFLTNLQNSMARVKTIQKHFGKYVLKFTCEECEGELLDTKVEINDTFLCCISFPELEQFVNDFDEVVSRYSI